MSSLAQRVMLVSHNLGSLENLTNLTIEVEAIRAELEQPDRRRSAGDLLRFRESLDFTCVIIARLRSAVRSQIGAIAGESTDAG